MDIPAATQYFVNVNKAVEVLNLSNLEQCILACIHQCGMLTWAKHGGDAHCWMSMCTPRWWERVDANKQHHSLSHWHFFNVLCGAWCHVASIANTVSPFFAEWLKYPKWMTGSFGIYRLGYGLNVTPLQAGESGIKRENRYYSWAIQNWISQHLVKMNVALFDVAFWQHKTNCLRLFHLAIEYTNIELCVSVMIR